MSDKQPKHPMQPIIRDEDGAPRFKANAIVRFLVDWAQPRGMSLHNLAILPFSKEEWEQLAQLIGYSVSGFGELSYASPEAVERADEEAEKLD